MRTRRLLSQDAWRTLTRFNPPVQLIGAGVSLKRVSKTLRKYERLMKAPRYGLFGLLSLEGFAIGSGELDKVQYLLRCECGQWVRSDRMSLLCGEVWACPSCVHKLPPDELEVLSYAQASNMAFETQIKYCTGTPNPTNTINIARKVQPSLSPLTFRARRQKKEGKA